VEPTLQTTPGWLTPDELDDVRQRVPMVYVDAVPVRLGHLGNVERVGLLLRHRPDATISRAIVSGRVLYNEAIRDALWRHLTKDLGPDSEPQLPPSPSPFTVVEYFPDEGRSGYHDPRQHAVALAFVVPVRGECTPSADTLDISWLSPKEAVSPAVAAEMTGGQDRVVRLALASAGALP
jgi:ADP-ribose pyrophosphatase YjhB (NUDIX family)